MTQRLTIGCSAVLSGHEKVHGEAIVRSVELAVEEAGPLASGTRLAVEAADDRDEPEAAREVATAFAAREDVMAVVGPMNSVAAAAAGPVFQAASLAHLSPAASNPDLPPEGVDTFFRLVADDSIQGLRAADFAVMHLKKYRLAVIHDNSFFCRPLAEVFLRRVCELGADVIAQRTIERGGKDFQALAAEMARKSPELIFLGVIEEEGLRLAPQLRSAGVGSIFLGVDGLKASRYLETPEFPAPGPFHTNASADPYNMPSAARFKAAFETRYGRPCSVYSAEAYDAAGIIIQALADCREPSRPNILRRIRNVSDYPGATGSISFDAKGNRIAPRIGFYELKPGVTELIGFDHDLPTLQSPEKRRTE